MQQKYDKDLGYSEADVKRWVKEVLNEYNVYYFMPVQSGVGAAALDFHCCVRCHNTPIAFFVETKRFNAKPTARQTLFIKQRKEQQNAKTFVIDGRVGVNELRAWLEKLRIRSYELKGEQNE
jgi:hypothetical protein